MGDQPGGGGAVAARWPVITAPGHWLTAVDHVGAARKKFGEEQVHIWRRSYDVPPPGGESLELTAKRTIPYYKEHILPRVQRGEKVIVAAHGNSLRSIIKDLENLTPEEILKVELATGVPIVYKFNEDGSIASKDILKPSSPVA
jgi:2,3-bisphosphoglycerate-dependent phosphoglycerate mutase